MEIDDETTAGDPHQNFLKIMETVKFLDDNGVIDEAWMTAHKELIRKYRSWIPNYAMVNEEITDKTFRKRCSDIETLLTHLCKTIDTCGRFDIRIYHIFMRNMKAILEYLFADDILEDAMGILAIK